jgi:uncharacterized protein
MTQPDPHTVPARSRALVPRRPRWLRWSVLVLGWGFLLVGLLGFLLPVIGGWLPFGLGLLLLSREQSWARRLVGSLRRRLPRLAAALDAAEIRAFDVARRLRHRLRVRWLRTKP